MQRLTENVTLIRARLLPRHAARLNEIMGATGLQVSGIMRQMIENAVIVPITTDQLTTVITRPPGRPS